MSKPIEQNSERRGSASEDQPVAPRTVEQSPQRAEQAGDITDALTQENLWRRFVEYARRQTDIPFEDHWRSFQSIFAGRRDEDGPPVVWRPDEETLTRSNIIRSMKELGLDRYEDFHRWSASDRAGFWKHALTRIGAVFIRPPEKTLDLSGGVKNPVWLPGALMNCVDTCFTAPGEKPAIISGAEGSDVLSVISYRELERTVNRVANGLRERGIAEDTPIAIYMPMTVECVAACLGIIRAGCRVVSIADSFSPAEVAARMRIAQARIIVTVDHYLRAGKRIALYEKTLQADVPQAIVVTSDPATMLRDADIAWEEMLSGNDVFPSTACNPYRPITVLFSSGTTGEPKGIPWTHLTAFKSAVDGHFHQDIHPDDVVAWPTNIGWMMGSWLIYASLMNQATMALYNGAPGDAGFARFVEKAGVRMLGVIPSIVRAWRTGDALEGADWTGLRLFSSTGEPSNRYDYLWLMSRTGYRAPVIEYLGGTEIGGGHIAGTVVQPCSPSAFTTMALGLDCVILDEDAKPVDEGAAAELFIIPPSMGLSQTLINRDHDAVYYEGCPSGPGGEILRRHGDQTLRLHRGFYRAQGRADDTMNLGGIKVSSLELERIIEGHESVYECAAVSVQPEGEGAEQLVVFVTLSGEIDRSVLMNDLKKRVASLLNPLFRIYDLQVVEALPRTASNKLMRRVLRAEYMQKKGTS